MRELLKDGSDLQFIVGRNEKLRGTIRRSFPIEGDVYSPLLWKRLCTGDIRADSQFDGVIPVEPILLRNTENGLQSRLRIHINPGDLSVTLMTRYCGLIIDYLKNKLTILKKHTKHDHRYVELHKRAMTLRTMIEKQIEDIRKGLATAGLELGHLHEGNFIVEFFRRDTYEMYIRQGYTVNSLPPFNEKGDQVVDFNPGV